MDNIKTIITEVINSIHIETNYDNLQLIYIYYITCKDINIKDNYIGQTINFENRKYSHETTSKNSELKIYKKIYKKIRENGGWKNWNMKILNTFYCKNEYYARQIEQKYMDYFKTTLNSVRAYSKTFINEELDRELDFILNNYEDKILGCFTYDYCDMFSEEKFNCEKQKKEIKIFNCESCFKILKSKRSYMDHLIICKALKLQIIKDKELEDLKNQIKFKEIEYKKELEITHAKLEYIKEISKEPKTINNTINNNNKYINMAPLILNKSDVKTRIQNDFTKSHFLEGQEGVAKCVYDSFLIDKDGKSKYIITNMNKGVFIYKDKHGDIKKDIQAYKLTNIVANDIIDKSKDIYNENKTIIDKDMVHFYQNRFIDIQNLKNNNSKCVNTLAKLNGSLELENVPDNENCLEEYEFIILDED